MINFPKLKVISLRYFVQNLSSKPRGIQVTVNYDNEQQILILEADTRAYLIFFFANLLEK